MKSICSNVIFVKANLDAKKAFKSTSTGGLVNIFMLPLCKLNFFSQSSLKNSKIHLRNLQQSFRWLRFFLRPQIEPSRNSISLLCSRMHISSYAKGCFTIPHEKQSQFIKRRTRRLQEETSRILGHDQTKERFRLAIALKNFNKTF